MNSHEQYEAPLAQEGTNGVTPLYLGDLGELSLETRRALVQLLLGPSLDARRHPTLWPALLRDESAIRKRLSEFFLDLVLDLDLGVAFTRQANTGDLEVPVLLRRSQLTFIDSVLLLHLRQRLSHAERQDERAVISADEMLEHLQMYERTSNTDHAGFTKRSRTAIEKLKKHSVLQKIRSSEDRFEISPTLKLLFSADEIQALGSAYATLARGEGSLPDEAITDEETET
jgi:hypothetical protein